MAIIKLEQLFSVQRNWTEIEGLPQCHLQLVSRRTQKSRSLDYNLDLDYYKINILISKLTTLEEFKVVVQLLEVGINMKRNCNNS